MSKHKILIWAGAGVIAASILLLTLTALPPVIWHSPIRSDFAIMDILKPRLEKYDNTYSLKKKLSLISEASAASPYDLATAYAVVDFETGEVIADKNPSERHAIASLTKIMTAIVTIDLVNPYDSFYVTRKAAEEIPTKVGLIHGQKLSVLELLHATLLTSANDAAELLSNGIDEKFGRGVFIAAMNEKARHIGLTNTHFDNPQGFDSAENYSTVEDLAMLTHYALTNYPLIAEIVKKDMEVLPASRYHQEFILYNWNGLIGVYPETTGVKIGNTGDAGRTTVVISERGGKKMMAVVLGAPGIIERDLWASQLLDTAYKETLNLEPINLTEDTLREKYATWKYWN